VWRADVPWDDHDASTKAAEVKSQSRSEENSHQEENQGGSQVVVPECQASGIQRERSRVKKPDLLTS
jgi:hypothetical protein